MNEEPPKCMQCKSDATHLALEPGKGSKPVAHLCDEHLKFKKWTWNLVVLPKPEETTSPVDSTGVTDQAEPPKKTRKPRKPKDDPKARIAAASEAEDTASEPAQ